MTNTASSESTTSCLKAYSPISLSIFDPLPSDKYECASFIVSMIYRQMKGNLSHCQKLADYIFTTLAPHVTILDVSGLCLTSEMVKTLEAKFRDLRILYARGSTFDKVITVNGKPK